MRRKRSFHRFKLFKRITKLENTVTQLNGEIMDKKDKIKKMKSERRQLHSKIYRLFKEFKRIRLLNNEKIRK